MFFGWFVFMNPPNWCIFLQSPVWTMEFQTRLYPCSGSSWGKRIVGGALDGSDIPQRICSPAFHPGRQKQDPDWQQTRQAQLQLHREQCVLGNGIQVTKWERDQKSIMRGESSYVSEVAPLSIIINFKGKAAKYSKDTQLMSIIRFFKVFSRIEGALLVHNQTSFWVDVSCALILSHESQNF